MHEQFTSWRVSLDCGAGQFARTASLRSQARASQNGAPGLFCAVASSLGVASVETEVSQTLCGQNPICSVQSRDLAVNSRNDGGEQVSGGGRGAAMKLFDG
jgi:hypothetical protein